MSDPCRPVPQLPHHRQFASRRVEVAAEVAWDAVWLWPLVFLLGDLIGGHVALPGLAAAGLAAFVVAYLATVHRSFAEQSTFAQRRLGLAAVIVLTLALSVGYGGDWTLLLVYLVACTAAALPLERVLPGVALGLGTAAAIGYGRHGGDVMSSVLISGASAGAIIFVVRHLIVNNRALHQARDELAETAVSEERLRFARDLHDLLGHTLSVIVVKAEVVRRLVDTKPAAAAAAAADIETVGRRALDDVREAVTGYRQRSLSAELDGAKLALADADIATSVRTSATRLPAAVESALGWAVRESVTNVVRHSHASRCDIELRRDDDVAVLEVRDDGIGATNGSARAGNGLRGLQERLALAGGWLDTSPGPDRGFRLIATIPLGQTATESSS